MARTQTVKTVIGKTKGKSGSKHAASWLDEPLSGPSKVFYRQASAGAYGKIVAAVTEEGQPCALILDPESKLSATQYVDDLRRRFPSSVTMQDCSSLSSASDNVRDMLDRLIAFVELQQSGSPSLYSEEAAFLQRQSLLYGSAFQRSVWRAMARIPLGSTCSYGELARKAGHDVKSTRAVAQACGTNPLTLLIPCHRIVAQGGGMGGYHWGTTVKQKILRDEAKNVKPKSLTLLRSV